MIDRMMSGAIWLLAWALTHLLFRFQFVESGETAKERSTITISVRRRFAFWRKSARA